MDEVSYRIDPRKALFALGSVILLLLIANCTGMFFEFFLGYGYIFGLVPLFDFDAEMNIPTLFSSFLLLTASLLLLLIGITHKDTDKSPAPWFGLFLIFLFLSIDELASLHENLNSLQETLDTSGALRFAWVIPYSIATMLLVMLYARFLLQLDRTYSILFILSGAVFCSGALGMELVGSYYGDMNTTQDWIYRSIATVEETLEMTGSSLFIYSLIGYITNEFRGLSLVFQVNNDNFTSKTILNRQI